MSCNSVLLPNLCTCTICSLLFLTMKRLLTLLLRKRFYTLLVQFVSLSGFDCCSFVNLYNVSEGLDTEFIHLLMFTSNLIHMIFVTLDELEFVIVNLYLYQHKLINIQLQPYEHHCLTDEHVDHIPN